MSSRHIRGHLVYKNYVEHTAAGDVTAAALANASLLLVNKGTGAATGVALPAAQYVGQAWKVLDAKGDAATNNITITPASGLVNGAATYVINENYGAVELAWDGTNYTISAQSNDVSAAEAAYLDVVAGTGAASKALVLDSSGNVAMPAAPASIDERNAEVVITTNVIAAAENGRTYYLSLAAGFTSTLPAPALGLKFKFIVKTAPTGAPYVITTNASGNVLFGMMVERAGGVGVAGTARDTFNFIHTQSIPGDWVEFESDGTNWYYRGMTDVSAGSTVAAT